MCIRDSREVEGLHRASAWRVVLDHVGEDIRETVVDSMAECLGAWKSYRDEVATACGLHQPV